ncbi:MAG TPA: type I-U CRISPR-associated protein Csx17, partial [Gemmatimonadaceae bacterium]|nr:type I-U CRISPR-associated protein Csx17 [Gemmatimonadaceae bacterium]
MSDSERPVEWGKTTFEGSRREQLRQTQRMTVRERLEALDHLTVLSERIQAMPRSGGNTKQASRRFGVREAGAEYQAPGPQKDEVVLDGCSPTPLANYLKALGVLRLLSAKHPETRGYWCGNRFVLRTMMAREAVERFFLDDYEPTPILAPWNGGSGFYEKDNKVALEAIRQSADPRFKAYRSCLDVAELALAGMDRGASPKGEDKAALLARVRGQLPDEALNWLDASVLLSGDTAQYPPLLGTGGNDGRLDFTNNFMQCVTDVLGLRETEASGHWLATALFSGAAPGLIRNAIGQFSPGRAGGPNATIGFGGTFQEAGATINPWDFVLMIEGALPFAATVARRNANDPSGVLSYPFTVRTVGAGA